MARKLAVIVAFILMPLFIAGCTDEKKLNEIEQKQEEILTKMAAIEENQKKILKFFQPRKPEIDFDKAHNIPVGSSPVKGNKNAPVTIVEFSDFQCPYCSRLQSTLKEVLDAYPEEVKLVFKNFPLSFHKQAKNAAKAAHAAGEQGKYWEMHDIVFENYNKLTEEKFKEFATQIGLDVKKFEADFNSDKYYDQQIREDMNLGSTVGVRGTPTLFLNGKRMRNRSFDDFKSAIDKILKK